MEKLYNLILKYVAYYTNSQYNIKDICYKRILSGTHCIFLNIWNKDELTGESI